MKIKINVYIDIFNDYPMTESVHSKIQKQRKKNENRYFIIHIVYKIKNMCIIIYNKIYNIYIIYKCRKFDCGYHYVKVHRDKCKRVLTRESGKRSTCRQEEEQKNHLRNGKSSLFTVLRGLLLL